MRGRLLTSPVLTKAGELGLTGGTCIVVSRLELAAVAMMLCF